MSKSEHIIQLITSGNKYEVISEFEEGANGYAFRAVHKPLQREVFLKIIDADPEASRTFAEPQALATVVAASACDNVVQLFDAERLQDDYILMSMEYVDGGSFNTPIKDRSLGQADIVRLVSETLLGVGHLHNAGFLHRDLKPGNLLIKHSAVGPIGKVGDFGSVRQIEEGQTSVSASKHSSLYRPPEAWGAQGFFGFSSDVYQIGICLYELLNGALPYDLGSYVDEIAQAQMKEWGLASFTEADSFQKSQLADGCIERRAKAGKLLELTSPTPCVSKRLAKILRKSTHVNAAERYQSAFDFVNDLHTAATPNWIEETSAFHARHWRGWDWQVPKSSQAGKWKILRAREGTQNYRAIGTPLPSIGKACKYVNDYAR